MTSNIRIQRICQHCGNEFTAKTTQTKYCGDVCAKRAYKARKRNDKINQSKTETIKIKTEDLNIIQQKKYLTVKEASILLSCSVRTTYRLIHSGKINAVNLSQRMTRIKRSAVNEIFKKGEFEVSNLKSYDISECYNLTEIQNKFNISRSTIQNIIRRENIPKFQKGKFVYIPKQMIDRVFN